MNTENIGESHFYVQNSDNSKNNKQIFINDDKKKVDNYITEYICKDNEKIQQCPCKARERTILYITGSSGSGKSFYAKNFGNEYRKMYPKNKIYLFSSINEDSSIDKINGLKRIHLNQNFLNTDLSIEDFKNTLSIFDDTDCIQDKIIRNKIDSILNILLETGRHQNASVIYTSHLPTNGFQTRRILNECNTITFFCKSLGGKSLKYLLENHLGLDKDQIKNVKNLPSRWVTYIKTYPNVIIYEKGAFIL
jgi:chromosomal replication initiation ATPase DnaA